MLLPCIGPRYRQALCVLQWGVRCCVGHEAQRREGLSQAHGRLLGAGRWYRPTVRLQGLPPALEQVPASLR